jgi:hypothetical protein
MSSKREGCILAHIANFLAKDRIPFETFEVLRASYRIKVIFPTGLFVRVIGMGIIGTRIDRQRWVIPNKRSSLLNQILRC